MNRTLVGSRWFAPLAALVLVGTSCIPDYGSALTPDAGSSIGSQSGAAIDAGAQPETDGEAGMGPAPAVDAGNVSPASASCDNSPPSKTLDVYVWGEGFQFYFTPAGADPKTLYVPVNAQVKFKIAGTPNEEAHSFKISIPLPGCATPDVMAGTQGAETILTWRAPNRAQTFSPGGVCTIHPGMDFPVVVTP